MTQPLEQANKAIWHWAAEARQYCLTTARLWICPQKKNISRANIQVLWDDSDVRIRLQAVIIALRQLLEKVPPSRE